MRFLPFDGLSSGTEITRFGTAETRARHGDGPSKAKGRNAYAWVGSPVSACDWRCGP